MLIIILWEKNVESIIDVVDFAFWLSGGTCKTVVVIIWIYWLDYNFNESFRGIRCCSECFGRTFVLWNTRDSSLELFRWPESSPHKKPTPAEGYEASFSSSYVTNGLLNKKIYREKQITEIEYRTFVLTPNSNTQSGTSVRNSDYQQQPIRQWDNWNMKSFTCN